ncbi:hypothetical protein Goklo_014078, partial [Gossypium klotzschianum]|nr:hypothetical protein [Gossypium klotzschianum]
MGSGVTLHSNILEAFLAKAKTYYQGLLIAKESGFAKVEVDGDSRKTIEKINQEGNSITDLDLVIVDIKAFGRTFHQIRFKHPDGSLSAMLQSSEKFLMVVKRTRTKREEHRSDLRRQ